MLDVVLKRFKAPDEIRTLVKGRFEIIRLGGITIGRATYEPGWKWSSHRSWILNGLPTAQSGSRFRQ